MTKHYRCNLIADQLSKEKGEHPDGLSREQRIQEDQYEFPYHYIPHYTESEFSQTRYWSWGMRYVGGLLIAIDLLRRIDGWGRSITSLVDIGCGDGRFLYELRQTCPQLELEGIDYSQRAIGMARAFNPTIPCHTLDIRLEKAPRKRDVATMIEVLEHIPVREVPEVLASVRRHVRAGGYLVVTVPHINKPVSGKHFQHFDSEKLRDILNPHFEILKFQPFDDVRSRLFQILQKTMGGAGSHYVVTNNRAANWLFSLYRKRYLTLDTETKCGRIAVLARAKSM